MSIIHVFVAIISLLLMAYLFYALIHPEKF